MDEASRWAHSAESRIWQNFSDPGSIRTPLASEAVPVVVHRGSGEPGKGGSLGGRDPPDALPLPLLLTGLLLSKAKTRLCMPKSRPFFTRVAVIGGRLFHIQAMRFCEVCRRGAAEVSHTIGFGQLCERIS